MPGLNSVKRIGARFLHSSGLNSLGLKTQQKFFSPYIRAINYHSITAEHEGRFREQLEFYSQNFVNVDEKAFRSFIETGDWPHTRPGIIISFDDGLSSHYTRAMPMLEEFGFTGWFFVPAGWIGKQAEDGESEDPPLTLEQLRALDERHVVGCHTFSHKRLVDGLSEETLDKEVVASKEALEGMLGRTVDIFCWVGGEEHTYSKAASDLVRDNYRIGFMTNTASIVPGNDPFQLQRTNIEAENPLSLVTFQLSGLMDLMYAPKRRRVNAVTA